MLSDSETSLLANKRDFSTFSKSRAIRKDFTHTCKNDKKKVKMTRSKDVSPTAQHDKKHANKKKNGVCGKQEPNAKGKQTKL